VRLVVPSIKFKESYLSAVEEGKYETGSTILSKPAINQSFDEFVEQKKEEALGLHLPKGHVSATELWLIDNYEFIGRANIRHKLTDHLLKMGGHIGYWIRPSKRKKGYGKKILALSLLEAEKLGVNQALVTCDDTNVASCKIIEANGGILDNIVENGKNNPLKRRYWIKL
jgi:predicted acetyltransferase